MKVRVFSDDEGFNVGGFRAVKKMNNEMMKKPRRGADEKRKDESRKKADRRPRNTDKDLW